VEAAHIPWRPIGELFVERGLISAEQLEEALAKQVATGQRLGEILVADNLISSPELTQALMEQLGQEIAKEEGFGSGLWAEIKRRQSRPDSSPSLSLVDDHGAVGPDLESEREALHDEVTDPLELDLDELKAELVGVGGPPPTPPEEPPRPDSPTIGVDRLKSELQERSATIDQLSRELEAAHSNLQAREQTFSDEIESWQHARRDADALREQLTARESRLVELEAEVTSLVLAREQESAAQTAAAKQVERDQDEARSQLDMHAARVAELETSLGERDRRIEELEADLTDAGAERDATVQRLAEAEARVAEIERQLADAQASPAIELEQQLALTKEAVVEFEVQVTVLRAQIDAADAALVAECDAHAETRRQSEEALAEVARGRDALHELDQTRAAVAELEERMSRHVAEAAFAREDFQQCEHELELAGGERDAARSELEQAWAAAAAEAASAREAFQQCEHELELARGERDAARSEIEQAWAAAAAEAASAREAFQQCEHELELARGERDAARSELEQAWAAAAELDRTRSDLDEARAAGLDLEHRFEVAARRGDELDRQVSELRGQLVALESTLAAERQALQDAECRRDDVLRDCDTARTALEQTRGTLADVELRATAAEVRTAELESILAEERDAHASILQTSARAQARLEQADGREAELVAHVERLGEERAALEGAAARERDAARLRCAEAESRFAEEAASHSETRRVLSQALDELTSGRSDVGPDGEPQAYCHADHVCFAAGADGYRLLAHPGPPPVVGSTYELDGVEYVVTKVGRSPLPLDRRRCAYLQAGS